MIQKNLSRFTKGLLLASFVCLFTNAALAMGSNTPKAEANDPQWVVPGIKAEKQQTNQWCWAAVSQAIMSTEMQKDMLPSQCEIASKLLNKECCAKTLNGRPSLKCTVPYSIQETLQAYGVSFNSVYVKSGTLKNPDYSDFDKVVAHVKTGKPVAIVAVMPTDEVNFVVSSHALLAYGAYTKADGSTYLVTWNPATNRTITFARHTIHLNFKWYNLVYVK